MKSRRVRRALLAVVGSSCSLVALPARALVTIAVNNLDGAAEGFNDTTPFTPVGGNQGKTLGQTRLIAFQSAASLWAAKLSNRPPALPSSLVIEIDAHFDPMTCSTSAGVLGSAGTNSVHKDFPGAPSAGTYYAQALANSLAGIDLAPGVADIMATFNSDVDNPSCLGQTKWYYGLDGLTPSGDIDLVTVVVHELAHGLGFQSFVSLSTGAKFLSADDGFMRHLAQLGASPLDFPSMTDAQRVSASVSDPNLVWLGVSVDAARGVLTAGTNNSHVRMHAPNPVQPGSSVSHFSSAAFPNQALEPVYAGPNHDPGLAVALLCDVGWTCSGIPATASPAWASALLALLLPCVALRWRTGRAAIPITHGGGARELRGRDP